MEDKTNIAIIGGGASGTIAAIHLLHEFKKPLRIYLLEKEQKFLFRGHAYSSSLKFERLNVPAGKMSIFSDLPMDFYDWLKLNRQQYSSSEITPESFVSRRWFGDYLAERLSEAKGKANNSSFEIIVSEVVNISLLGITNQYEIELSDRKYIDADSIVFATGNEAPADLLNNMEKALLGTKYVANPWQGNPFERLSPADNVLIMGSGLSMVDHAISLYKQNHSGKIYCFSRHGLLPLPQQIGADGNIDFNADTSEIFHVFKALRSVVKKKAEQGIGWQQIINSLRDKTPAIWRRLSPSSKRTFLNRLKPFWEVHRHRIPLESAQLIDEMLIKGRLELLSGTRKPITVKNGGLVFQFIHSRDKSVRSVKIDYVINCTGPSNNYTGYGNQLIRSLLKKGWMKQDELRLGIETGYNGEILTTEETHLPNAYAIGPLRKAAEWESTAIREIKIQAEQLALDIALNDADLPLMEDNGKNVFKPGKVQG